MSEIATHTHEDSGTRSDKDAVHLLGHMYAEYLHVNSNDQTQPFEDSIEDLLTKLDEYHGLLDVIRSDTTLCLQKNLPLIQVKNAEMQTIFQKIDKLEAFVAMVKHKMADLESDVERAEADMGSLSAIKKVFSSLPIPFLSSKKPASPTSTRPRPQHTTSLFKWNDYVTTNSTHLTSPNDAEGVNRTITDTSPESNNPADCIEQSKKQNVSQTDQSEKQNVSQTDQSGSSIQTSQIGSRSSTQSETSSQDPDQSEVSLVPDPSQATSVSSEDIRGPS